MVREYPALARDLSKNSGNPAFAHPNLCPETLNIGQADLVVVLSAVVNCFFLIDGGTSRSHTVYRNCQTTVL